jgi:FG-GAP-like repeat/FG-GAP repeat
MVATLSSAPNLELNQSTTNFSINNSASVIAPGLQILSLNTASSLPQAQVSIANYTSSSAESLSVVGAAAGATSGTIGSTGISWSYANGVITLSGNASYGNYQAALRQVTYNNTSPTLSTTRDIRFTLGDLAINATGDRAYKYVGGDFTWSQAQIAAASTDYFGTEGYLTTITSAAENNIVKSVNQGIVWFGGSDSAVEGNWRWVTGPEAGTIFYQNGTLDNASSSGSYTPPTLNTYSGWLPEEPNNSGGSVNGEDYTVMFPSGWNDWSSTEVAGYVVEYGGLADQPVLQLAGTTTISYTNQIIPIARDNNITFRNNATGQNAIWQLNGATLTDSKFITSVPDKNWTMVASGDFDGDGEDDLLWRNYATGENAIWLKDGANLDSFSASGQKFLTRVTDTEWKMITAADFNGDGKADILWRNSRTGENAIWFMDATTVTVDGRYASDEQFFVSSRRFIDTNWEMVGAGNFDTDNKADIVWRNKVTGENAIWLMDGTSGTAVASKASGEKFITRVADSNWKIVGIGDFNGDNKSDLAWHNSVTGENAIWTVDTSVLTNSGNFSTNEQFIVDGTTGAKVLVPGNAWRIEAVGDTDGDGKSDLIWRNYGPGVDADKEAVWQMDGNISATSGRRYVIFPNASTVFTGDLNWDIVDSHIA